MNKFYFLLLACKEISQNLEVRAQSREDAQELTVGHRVPRARAKLNPASCKEIKCNYHPHRPMYKRKWKLRNLKARSFLKVWKECDLGHDARNYGWTQDLSRQKWALHSESREASPCHGRWGYVPEPVLNLTGSSQGWEAGTDQS